ncbi:hypothetical protein [Haladaptatus paucihalophilus]|uniref:Uncharacterized protein n=1 Tax=Haladaptatus paucihalophilus DX253 TaxID=797209 RepID=A0A1M6W019_HALPU|nr:hypothetical protein [Haladaptatus paucihalophilus]SHK87060.1 hypothetical protein SAMN05444342_2460 [Haladaptatus paucihalophilus DX253]
MSKDIHPITTGTVPLRNTSSQGGQSYTTTCEIAYGTSGYDREIGETRYYQLPSQGRNKWVQQIWFSDKPSNPYEYGDYIYQCEFTHSINVLPTTAPDGKSISEPAYLEYPHPDNDEWVSHGLVIQPSAAIGPFSVTSEQGYVLDIGPTSTVKQDNEPYGKITWDRSHLTTNSGWSDSQDTARGVRVDVVATNLDPSKDYAPNGNEYQSGDIGVESTGTLSYTYDIAGTRIYETADPGPWYEWISLV